MMFKSDYVEVKKYKCKHLLWEPKCSITVWRGRKEEEKWEKLCEEEKKDWQEAARRPQEHKY